MATTVFNVGDQARVKSTGIEVIISQVSEHGFAIVKFDCGYERMLLINQLEPVQQAPAGKQAAA